MSKVLTLNSPIALIFVLLFLGSFQTRCQQELDQVLERISTMRLPDERGPLEHLYSLHIPNCDKHGLYNLKQVSEKSQSPRAGCTPPAALGSLCMSTMRSHRGHAWAWADVVQISHVAWTGLVTVRCTCSHGLASEGVRPMSTCGCKQTRDGESI